MRPRSPKHSYPGVPQEPGYYVYELWADEVCLYVGRVGNSGPGSMYYRLKGHQSAKPWFCDVTRIVVSNLGSHDAIVAEEPRRIQALRPLYNKQWSGKLALPWQPDPQARKEAYFRAYNEQPGRIATERAREAGHGRQRYYATRNALPEVKVRKQRWALKASRRPGPGQAGLF